jgi:hypothetical protein
MYLWEIDRPINKHTYCGESKKHILDLSNLEKKALHVFEKTGITRLHGIT